MRNVSGLKLCFLAGTLEHGGAERQLFYILHSLCQGGAAPRVLCFDHGEFWEKPIRSLGVQVSWVGQQRSRLGRLFRILCELQNDPPDVVQSHHFFANAYAGLAGAFLHMKNIGAMRSDGAADLRKNGLVGGWLNLRSTEFIAANSRLAIRQAVRHGVPASRLYFLPNVVDTHRFQPALCASPRPPTLVAVGRVVKEKRLDRFIDVLARLRRELNLDCRGLIVGPVQDQRLRNELETQSARLGLFPGALEFLGGVSDMSSLYQRADVCVLTSDFEGTPNAVLEAMACGVPVVAAKVGGVPDIIQDRTTGLMVDRQDQEALFRALAELLRNPELRAELGSRARQQVEENHSLLRLPVYLGELYDLVLPAPRPWKLGVRESTSV